MKLDRFFISAAAALLFSCIVPDLSAQTAGGTSFPVLNQDGKTAIVCHRGWWKCADGGMSENSIASLRAAQNAGFKGSECDVHVTADGVLIVNHDPSIAGKKINTHNFSDFSADILPNGEHRPTFGEYLDCAKLCPGCVLVIELKKQSSKELEDKLVDGIIADLKEYGMYDPAKVNFISFSRHICRRIAAEHPSFVNQFLLSKNLEEGAPDKIAAEGINGIDYHYNLFIAHPEWVARAHALGMSVNVWTVDDEDCIKQMAALGVDTITTNEPGLVWKILGGKELR